MLLSIPIRNKNKSLVMLNDHIISELKGVELRSFTMTPNSLSISIQKQVNEIEPESVIGIDRNLQNITISTHEQPIIYKTGKLLSIKENTMHVIASFRRNDRRVKNKFYSQKKNRSRRIQQFLHKISKDIVSRATQSRMIVLEDIKGNSEIIQKGKRSGK